MKISNFRRILLPIEWLTAILLAAMMLVTFADVLGRYLFNAPIFGAAEMIQFLLAGTVFSALGLVTANDQHIAVDLIAPKLRSLFPTIQPLLVSAFTFVGLMLISIQLIRIGVEAIHTDKATIVLEWPIAIIVLPCGVLCFVAAVSQILGSGANRND